MIGFPAMQARLESDLKAAMKAGEKTRVATLRLLLAAVKNEKIRLQRDLTGEEVEALIRRAVRERREAIEQYARGGREDLAAAEREESAILEGYLPKGMDDLELTAALQTVIEEKGFASQKDVGLVMKELMAKHRGRVDGKRAQEIARSLLQP